MRCESIESTSDMRGASCAAWSHPDTREQNEHGESDSLCYRSPQRRPYSRPPDVRTTMAADTLVSSTGTLRRDAPRKRAEVERRYEPGEAHRTSASQPEAQRMGLAPGWTSVDDGDAARSFERAPAPRSRASAAMARVRRGGEARDQGARRSRQRPRVQAVRAVPLHRHARRRRQDHAPCARSTSRTPVAVYGGDAGCDPKTLAGVANEDADRRAAVNIALVDTSAARRRDSSTMRPAGVDAS